MDFTFEMSSNERFESSISIGNRTTSLELKLMNSDLLFDRIEFKEKLLKGLIDIDELINDTIDIDLLINLTRNCKN